MTFSHLKKLHGVAGRIRFDRETCAQLLAVNKELMIAARLAQDDPRAAELSQAKQLLKKRAAAPNCCPGTPLRECGVVIGRKAMHCRTCTVALRVPVAAGLPVPLPQSQGVGRKVENPEGLVRAMELTGGNVQAARRLTGVDEQTLLRHAGHIRGGQRVAQEIPIERIIALEQKFGGVGAAEVLGVNRKTIWRRLKIHAKQQAQTQHAE